MSLNKSHDHDHAEMGKDLYQELSEERYSRVKLLCSQSWDILSLMLNRIADLTLEKLCPFGKSAWRAA